MMELVSNAYGVKADKVIGGPNWLEMDKFDVIGAGSAGYQRGYGEADAAVAAGRTVRSGGSRRYGTSPAYVLTASKKPSLKEAAASEDSGCKFEPPAGGDGRGGPSAASPTGRGADVSVSCL